MPTSAKNKKSMSSGPCIECDALFEVELQKLRKLVCDVGSRLCTSAIGVVTGELNLADQIDNMHARQTEFIKRNSGARKMVVDGKF